MDTNFNFHLLCSLKKDFFLEKTCNPTISSILVFQWKLPQAVGCKSKGIEFSGLQAL